MHIHTFLNALVATIGTIQALVLPQTTSDIEARAPMTIFTASYFAQFQPATRKIPSNARPVLRRPKLQEQNVTPKSRSALQPLHHHQKLPPSQLLQQNPLRKRQPKKTKATAKPTTTKTKPTPAPKQPCKPKPGKKCKRKESEDDQAEIGEFGILLEDLNIDQDEPANNLAKRVETLVPMRDTRTTPWGLGDSIPTNGLSVCSVVAVWDQNRVVLTHIPPGEPLPNGDIRDSGATIRLFLGRIDAELQRTPLINPKSGYFLASDTLLAADKTIVRNWAVNRGISLQTRPYSFTSAPGTKLTLKRPATGTGSVSDEFNNPERR